MSRYQLHSRLPMFHILLVDDVQSDAEIFETALREASARARVYWVATGTEAIDFLHQRGRFKDIDPVQLVILDLHLPGEDGLSVLRAIKSNPDLSRKPVIMLSSATAQSEVDLAYSLGANAFFRKPMSLDSYIDMVKVITKHWLDLAQLPSSGRLLGPPSEEFEREQQRFGGDDQGLR